MERSIHVDKAEYAAELFGSFDVNAKRLEKAFGVTFSCRDSQIHVIGEEPGVSRAVRAAESLLRLVEKGEVLNDQNVGYCIDMVMEDREAQMAPLTDGCICITAKGKPVKPKTVGQKNYCDNIRNNTITIGVGPAGTGKDVPCGRHGCDGVPCAAGEPHHLDAPRRGSRREAGLSAR